MSKKMLVVLTNTAKYPTLKRATGLWLGEAVHFVEKVEKAGYTVDYVSPQGGYVPVDPHSLQMAPDLDWQWYDDKAFMTRLGTSLSPGQVKADEYSVIYYTGGHGVMYDFAENKPLQEPGAQGLRKRRHCGSGLPRRGRAAEHQAQRQQPSSEGSQSNWLFRYRGTIGRAWTRWCLFRRKRS